MSGRDAMDVVEMPLDEYAAREGIKGRRRRGRGHRQGKGNGPVTSTQNNRRKSSEQHKERAKNHREERKGGRRLFQDLEKPKYSSVVFGNGTPEKVLTRPASEPMPSSKRGKEQQPVSIVQAALDRGRQLFLKKQGRGRGKEAGGKRQSLPREPRKRPVIQPPTSRKLHIVRPSDPGFKRQLRQLRDNTYAVRLVSKPQQQKGRSQTVSRRIRKPNQGRSSGNVPEQRLMGPQSRRIVVGGSRGAGSTSGSGPLSDRFSNITFK